MGGRERLYHPLWSSSFLCVLLELWQWGSGCCDFFFFGGILKEERAASLTRRWGGADPKGTLGLEHPPVLLLGAYSWFGALFCSCLLLCSPFGWLHGSPTASLLSWGAFIPAGL